MRLKPAKLMVVSVQLIWYPYVYLMCLLDDCTILLTISLWRLVRLENGKPKGCGLVTVSLVWLTLSVFFSVFHQYPRLNSRTQLCTWTVFQRYGSLSLLKWLGKRGTACLVLSAQNFGLREQLDFCSTLQSSWCQGFHKMLSDKFRSTSTWIKINQQSIMFFCAVFKPQLLWLGLKDIARRWNGDQ